MTEKSESLSQPTATFNGDTPDDKGRRLIQLYKIVAGNAWYDLETRVNAFLSAPGNEGFQAHGDIQMYSYSEYVQVLTGYKYVNQD